MKEIGLKIKKIRKSKGLTIYDLSAETGISHTAISNIENDKTKSITIETGISIAKILNVSFCDLFEIDCNTGNEDLLEMVAKLTETVKAQRETIEALSENAKATTSQRDYRAAMLLEMLMGLDLDFYLKSDHDMLIERAYKLADATQPIYDKNTRWMNKK